MKRLFAFCALVLLAGCGAKSAAPLTVTPIFSPNPPRQGNEAVTVALKDADGKPVTGASVTVSTSMPNMSMPGPSAVAKDNGDGTYTAHIMLQYPTTWAFHISASANGDTTATDVKQNVR
ncbi:MAG: FixH family protein [Vulcanimicrobiaceae bacterium]